MSNQNLFIYSGIGITSVIGAILSYKYNLLSFFDEEEKENKEEKEVENKEIEDKKEIEGGEKEAPPDDVLVIKKSKRKTIKRKTPRKRRY
jgi:hypothetical protein